MLKQHTHLTDHLPRYLEDRVAVDAHVHRQHALGLGVVAGRDLRGVRVDAHGAALAHKESGLAGGGGRMA